MLVRREGESTVSQWADENNTDGNDEALSANELRVWPNFKIRANEPNDFMDRMFIC